MKAFLSSPYASYIGSEDEAVLAAMRSLVNLQGYLHTVIHVNEVRETDNCVWSPLVEGQIRLHDRSGVWPWDEAMIWCEFCLEQCGFDTVIIATIPRIKNYGPNGQDREITFAKKLGYRIMHEHEVPNDYWSRTSRNAPATAGASG